LINAEIFKKMSLSLVFTLKVFTLNEQLIQSCQVEKRGSFIRDIDYETMAI